MNNDPLRIFEPGFSGSLAAQYQQQARELIDAWRDEWHLEPEPEMDNGTFKIYESLVGYVARALKATAATPPTATAAEPTHDQVVQAITDIQQARDSHEQWATHLRQPHASECQGCEDHAAHIGDAEYHDEWIAKYDNVIYVLAHAPFTAVAATSGAREAAAKEIIELDLNGRYDPYDPHSRNAILGILSKHFPSAVPVEEPETIE